NPGAILLSWKDLSESEDAYILERSDADGNNFMDLAQLGPDENTYTDTDIEPGLLYYYRIRTSAGEDTTIAETVSQLASSATSSKESLREQIPFKVYPNPASDRIYIKCEQGAEILSIKIIDMNGSLLKQFKPAGSGNRYMYTYDCQDLMRGSYIIQLYTKDGAWTVPLLVVK
ncbi:MAG: T9SS type A sorting domain-containing protein, partial [Bacteroidales bacterium]|nr:T9SS type A sorting domain-containing protein [Bacteroidales bacterium]